MVMAVFVAALSCALIVMNTARMGSQIIQMFTLKSLNMLD